MLSFISKYFIKATTLSFFIFLNKPLGFIRDVAKNAYFGFGSMGDAFLISWKIPDTFRRVFSEGMLSQVLLPELTSLSLREGKRALEEMISSLLLVFQSVTLCFAIVMSKYSDLIISFFSQKTTVFFDAALMFSLLIYFIFFLIWSSVLGVALQHKKKFYVGPQSQVVLNCLLIGEFFLAKKYVFSCQAISYCFLFNSFFLFLFHSFFFYREGYRYRWPSKKAFCYLFSFLKRFFVTFMTTLSLEINGLLGVALSRSLASGMLSLVDYVHNLVRIPQQIFGNALVTVMQGDIVHCIEMKDESRLITLVKESVLFFLLLSVTLFCITILFGKIFFSYFFYIMGVEGNFLIESYNLSLLFLSGLFPLLVNRLWTTVLYGYKQNTAVFFLQIATLILQNILLYFMLPFWQSYALGISSVFSEYLRLLIFFFLFSREIKGKILFLSK
jgi:putative peptidoglycan lipid II flippase